MPRWHFRNRSHPRKGMCRMGAVSGVHGCESGFHLSLWFSRWASDSASRLCSQMAAPRWQVEGHPRHCTGRLLLPELPHAMGPPAAGCLTQLDCCWRCAGAGSALLAAACLPFSSELCPSPLLSCCAGASRLYWVFNYHYIQRYADAMQNSQWGWARWTQEKHS